MNGASSSPALSTQKYNVIGAKGFLLLQFLCTCTSSLYFRRAALLVPEELDNVYVPSRGGARVEAMSVQSDCVSARFYLKVWYDTKLTKLRTPLV